MFTKVGKSMQKAAIVDKNGYNWAKKDKSRHRVGKKWAKVCKCGQKWAENGHKVSKSGQKKYTNLWKLLRNQL